MENLGAQQLLDGVAVREIKERVEKLEEAAQTVTISVPYISQDQYLGHPADPNNYSRRSLPTKKLAIAFLKTCSPETADTTGESSARTDKLTEILQKVLLTIDT